MRGFLKGFLIGIAAVCLMALGWIFLIQPGVTRCEAQSIKSKYTQQAPGADSSGGSSLQNSQDAEVPVLDFAALQQAYPDVKAWLTIPGTAIDYPVAQSSTADPERYLRRNLDGKYRVAGTLFFQADCSLDGRAVIVYGHNMNDGTMFGRLPMYMDRVFFGEHSQIFLQTPGGTRAYHVAAALETDVSHLPFNRTAFAGDADFLSYAESFRASSHIKTEVPITAGSRLLVLVTCSYSWPDARYIVVAVWEP